MSRSLGFAAAAAFAIALSLPAATALAKRSVYSIAIGNNQAPPVEDGTSDLHYADDDAVRYFELFRRAGKHAALLTVLDSASQRRYAALGPQLAPPTLESLQRTLSGFLAEMERDRRNNDQPVLIITYSGHGSQDERGDYFLSFLDGGLTQQRLYDEILAKLSGVEVHLIFDACNAEGVVGTRGPFDRESDAEVVELDGKQQASVVQLRSLRRFPFVGALIATAEGQATHEWSRIEAGVFTHEIISALSGAADVNGDLRVEYSEVQAFVMAANQTISDARAVPRLVAKPPAARPHAVLMDLRDLSEAMFLTGSGDEVGRISLVLPDGRRMLDAHLRGATRVVLAVPRQPGLFLQRGEREVELPAHSSRVAIAELALQHKRAAPRGSLDQELRDGLFEAPFSVDYYRGIVDGQALVAVDFAGPSPLPTDQATSSRDGAGTDRAATRPRWLAPALLVTSGVALTVAASMLVLALNTKSDFDRTDRMRDAYALRDRYYTEAALSATAAAIAAGSGVGAWILWPRSETGAAQVGLRFQSRF